LPFTDGAAAGNGESTGTFRFGNYMDEVEEIYQAKSYLESVEKQKVVGLVGEAATGAYKSPSA
jgi:hypothetical protein